MWIRLCLKFCDFLSPLEDKFVWTVYCINISDIFKSKAVRKYISKALNAEITEPKHSSLICVKGKL